MKQARAKTIRDALGQYFRSEIDQKRMAQEKRAFIREHFEAPPIFVLRPLVWAPALVFVIAAFMSLQFMRGLQTPSVLKAAPSSEVTPTVEAAAEDGRVGGVSRDEHRYVSPVEVKHISSKMGPTMVYQKSFEGRHITIVWVFAGGVR